MFDSARVTFDLLPQQRRNILTVHGAWKIIAGRNSGVMVKARPLKKVLRIVWISAHVTCPDIQQMLRTFGAVGYTAANSGASLNENYGDSAA
jgi:hypothetical protein